MPELRLKAIENVVETSTSTPKKCSGKERKIVVDQDDKA